MRYDVGMKISLVIPVKNEEKIIEDCLNAIGQQTLLPHEVLICDNNSQDSTYEIVETYIEAFNTRNIDLRIHRIPEGNQIEARQYGFDAATGDVIVTLDADTRLDPEWLSTVNTIFKSRDDVVGVGGVLVYKNNPVVTATQFIAFVLYATVLRQRFYFYGSNGAFRKSAYEASEKLNDCRLMYEQYAFQEPYDDLYVSYSLKEWGKVVPVFSLRAQALARGTDDSEDSFTDSLKRNILQVKESLRLQNILLKRLRTKSKR